MKERRTRVWTEEEIKLIEHSTTLTAELHGLSCPACKRRKHSKSRKGKGNWPGQCEIKENLKR